MEREPVTSSNIKSVGYDAGAKVLEVEFSSGGLFRYSDVPATAHAELMAAKSVGSHFAQHIRGNYTASKVERDATEN